MKFEDQMKSVEGLIIMSLFTVFAVLKIAGVIAWPWLWVLSPLWLGPLLIYFVAVIFVILFIASKIHETFQ